MFMPSIFFFIIYYSFGLPSGGVSFLQIVNSNAAHTLLRESVSWHSLRKSVLQFTAKTTATTWWVYSMRFSCVMDFDCWWYTRQKKTVLLCCSLYVYSIALKFFTLWTTFLHFSSPTFLSHCCCYIFVWPLFVFFPFLFYLSFLSVYICALCFPSFYVSHTLYVFLSIFSIVLFHHIPSRFIVSFLSLSLSISNPFAFDIIIFPSRYDHIICPSKDFQNHSVTSRLTVFHTRYIFLYTHSTGIIFPIKACIYIH